MLRRSHRYYSGMSLIAFTISMLVLFYGVYCVFTGDLLGMMVSFLLAIYLQFDAKVSNVEAKIALLDEKLGLHND
jgi:hypothetical protein